jgi:hypothetical protein
MPRKSICEGSSNRCPACITAPKVPTCTPSSHPGVIFAAARGHVPLDPRRALAKFWLDPQGIYVGRLDDVRIG